jgi:L-fuconolactonase
MAALAIDDMPAIPTPNRIDSHHHVWRIARGDYGWLTPRLGELYRDYTLDDLAPLREASAVGATVLVQAAPTVAETEFLLSVAHASGGLVKGVVGWVDLAAADAVPTLTRLARDPLLKSVRPMLQDLDDPAWIIRPDVLRALAALRRLSLRLDALVTPIQLPALVEMLERVRDLPVVLDHGGKPPIAAGGWEPWASLVAACAKHSRVRCKLSGLATEAGANWTIDTLRPYVNHLIDCFGAERIMWGSDWPVVERAGGYRRWVAATVALLASRSDAERAAIWSTTARRFYGLE